MASKSGKFDPLTAILLCSLLLNLIFFVKDYRRSVVTHVVDGDTLQLADNRRVRLRSIDAPEKDRCMATEAKQFLEQLALNRHIRLKDQIIDEYGRIVAIVIVEDFRGWFGYMTKRFDPLLNRSLALEGLARVFSSGSVYDALLKVSAEQAKQSKRGIYATACRQQVDPNGCAIKGNIRSGKKTYYLPVCKDYKSVEIDTSYGDTWFCTETDAVDAGFSPAPRCN